MCGQLGVYSTNFTSPEFKYFHDLLFLNVFRGDHSTGVIRIAKDEKKLKVTTKKTLQSSPDFLRSTQSDICYDTTADGKKQATPLALLGHTRHATKGKISLQNAHPFRFPCVIGTHNGTINKKFKHRDEYETDSEAFYRNINDYGIVEAIKEVNDWDSAYAIQWVDIESNTLNFVRNSRRPLFFTYLYGGTTMIWSSEAEALRLALKHQGYTTNTGWKKDTTDKIFTLKPHEMLQIKLGERPDTAEIVPLGIDEKKTTYYQTGSVYMGTSTRDTNSVFWERHDRSEEAKKIQREALPGNWTKNSEGVYEFRPSEKKTSTVLEGSGNQKGSNVIPMDRYSSGTTSGTESTSSLTCTQEKSSLKRTNYRERFNEKELKSLAWLSDSEDDTPPWDFEDLQELPKEEKRIKGFQGIPMTEREFSYRLNQGCSCCGTVFSLDDPHDYADINKMRWFDRSNWVCDNCYENSEGDWVKFMFDSPEDEVKVG